MRQIQENLVEMNRKTSEAILSIDDKTEMAAEYEKQQANFYINTKAGSKIYCKKVRENMISQE